jgi:hypothetical protein
LDGIRALAVKAHRAVFSRFDTEFNDTFFTAVICLWREKMSIKKMTIGIDSIVIMPNGDQDGAEVGYHPNRVKKLSVDCQRRYFFEPYFDNVEL